MYCNPSMTAHSTAFIPELENKQTKNTNVYMYVDPSAHRNNYRNTDVCYNVSTWWILNLSGVMGKVLARSLKADIRNLTTSIKCILWFEVPTSNETFSLYHRNFDNSTHLTPIYMLDLIHSTHFVAEIVNQYDVQRGQTMTFIRSRPAGLLSTFDLSA